MSSRGPGDGNPTGLALVRNSLSAWKPRIVKVILASVAALAIAAEVIDPLGNFLKGQGFLGGSFAALIALILFDAISDSGSRPGADGVYVMATWHDLFDPMRKTFDARHVRIDFSGFTMETLLTLLRPSLQRLADEEVHTQELTLRIIVAHLNRPMSLPGKLEAAPAGAGHPVGTLYFTDSVENRERMRDDYTKPNWDDLKGLLDRVRERNPRITITCEVRESPQIPERKLYIFNQEKVFQQPYGINERTKSWRGNDLHILDTEGFGPRYGRARVLGWDIRSSSRDTQEIAEHHMEWHRNLWETLEYIKPENPIIADPRWVPREPRGGGR
ncbi:hypothetical protein [Streptomyces muensis]|uniref:Uncharacterized protein n=1 Tax=Streptomyces muensis TaxID=1077944 RepID=A0A9X1Q636_STRM4|nr:hypothetical protein [Streptomyces muensis]MCF1598563.1 hypothetical protein [Streptomyces muensis]